MQSLEAANTRLKNDTDLVNLDMHLAKGPDWIERSLPS
jgi:hypothetical protein